MKGTFITFEGTEGSGKTTQIGRLAHRLQERGRIVRVVREPGGTSIGEEIRHTLKHSPGNHAMTPEAELLLINASRAQLVKEVILPALDAGEVLLCDRFADSSVVYQGFGRGLNVQTVRQIVGFAVGALRPHLTLLLTIPLDVSEARRMVRGSQPGVSGTKPARDRFEEADRAFFERVEEGYRAIAQAEPDRVRVIDGTRPEDEVAQAIWAEVERWTERSGSQRR
jgi:dTMP kinase